MQLIQTFRSVFQLQDVPCLLFPYEVVTLGPAQGLIEMLNDVVTFGRLFTRLGEDGLTLGQFFDTAFGDKKQIARENFMQSLVGYSLLTYFLQVKDRHNDNIMLRRDGALVHIDFGFFLSSAPGRGVELERPVPFKLLTAYTEVLGSINSELAVEFRRLFQQGFRAVIKHRQRLISMVRTVYASQGQIMKCFSRGDAAINQFEARLSPPRDLQRFCTGLIEGSLNNWRVRWYDKFQYAFQKIAYQF